MRGMTMIYVDQYGHKVVAATVKELRAAVGGGRVAKMYRDKVDGTTVHCGYVVGPYWLTAYAPVELPA